MSNLKELITERDSALEKIALLKTDLQIMDNRIDEIVGEKFRVARQAIGKDTGAVNLKIDGVEVKQDIPKNVKWDQAELEQTYGEIKDAGDNPEDYITLSYKVTETVYTKMPDWAKAVFDKARTVGAGKPKLSFKLLEA